MIINVEQNIRHKKDGQYIITSFEGHYAFEGRFLDEMKVEGVEYQLFQEKRTIRSSASYVLVMKAGDVSYELFSDVEELEGFLKESGICIRQELGRIFHETNRKRRFA